MVHNHRRFYCFVGAGIMGGNATGSYEDIFCKDVPQRGLVILGDSATAHFHIPPQWYAVTNVYTISVCDMSVQALNH